MAAVTALRGVLAGLAGLGFVSTLLFARTGLVSVPVLAGIGVASVAALFAAGGRSAVRRLAGRGKTTESGDDGEWWLARVEPALDGSWNAWSDLVLAVGLGVLGVGALGVLVAAPGDDPPLGLLVVGFLGINGALIALAFAAR